GSVTVLAGANWSVRAASVAGTGLGNIGGDYPGVYMSAVEPGDPLLTTGSAAARGGFCGWLNAGMGDYTADGLAIIAQTVAWLLDSSVAAHLTATAGGTADLGATVPSVSASATLTATTG